MRAALTPGTRPSFSSEPCRLRHCPNLWPPRPRISSPDRKSTRLNSSHLVISYAVFCLKKKTGSLDPCHAAADSDLDRVVNQRCALPVEEVARTEPEVSACAPSALPGGRCFFFFNDTAPTEIYPLSLHDALPISSIQPLIRREPAHPSPGSDASQKL